MRNLLACTAIAPVLGALTLAPAYAETTIGTAITTPVKTSTAASGSADDVTVSSAGSITLTSGTAITADSNNKVTNAGTLKITGANDSSGIVILPGTTGDISSTGTITLDEDYTPTDTDSDGDIDGPFAQGARKNGIWLQSGAAGHSGAIASSGTITIEGNDSAGIRLDGPLTGSLSTSGTIVVTGDNSYGVQANDISGNVTLRGTTAVRGANSVGAALDGDIGGTLKIQGTITASGYRNTTAPTDVSKLDADDLLQGGSAVRVAGNVAGGIIFDVPPTNISTTDTDVDKDGLPDATEGSAAVFSYGAAPAVAIGSAVENISVGAVTGNTSGYGLIVNGAVGASGVYAGVDGTGMLIGGQGGTVAIAKGMVVNGSVSAASLDSNATAIRIGSGATVDTVEINGSAAASGSKLANTSAIGLLIDTGATTGTIKVGGTVAAGAVDTTNGKAVAILDRTGGVTSLANTGKITASGGKTGSNIAIDLSANSSGVTVTQALASATATAPAIIGDIVLGSGNDMLSVSAGSITGNTTLGAGNDSVALSGTGSYVGNIVFSTGNSLSSDALSLAGTSSMTGTADFGGGVSSLTLADNAIFTGQLANSGNLAVAVNGGTLNIATAGSVSMASLSVGANGTIGVAIDSTAGTHTVYDVSGAATFAQGSKVRATLSNVADSAGDYVIVRAGSLTGTPTLSTAATILPYMFKGSVASNMTTGEVTLSIAAKTVSELGLRGSQASAYSAIFNALDNDAAVADAYLAIGDGQTLTAAVQQMLPDHAGGTFEAVTSGSRATARILSDPGGIYRTKDGNWGFWLNQVGFGSAKSLGSTASYDIKGWGASAGGEYLSGLGAFGASFAYIHGSDSSGGNSNAVDSDQFELAAHWRGDFGPLQTFARVSAAQVDFSGTRRFALGGVTRTAEGNWSGKLYSAAAGASYEMRFGRISLRPAIGIDYYRLKEKGYGETGGGDAFNLIVGGRTSDELTANGTVSAGYDFASLDRAEGWARVEIEGGRRQILGGSLGDTTARFAGGQTFTLVSEDRTDGFTGRVRLIGGNDSFRVGGEFSAEEQQNHVAIALRATVNFAL